MKKILMIVQNDFVNDSRIIKEANSLGKSGYEVKVLALYREGLKQEESFEHFTVKRMYLSTREKLGKSKFSQVFKFIEFKNKCIKFAKEFKPDAVHCHDVYTLPIGEKIYNNFNKKIKFVYDSHELWSEASNNKTMPKVLLNYQNKLEAKIIKNCDNVITVSDSIAHHLKKIYSLNFIPQVIRNIPYKREIKQRNLFRERFNIKDNQKIILYQGAVASGRGIELLLDAVSKMNDDFVLVVLGNGDKVNKYKAMSTEKHLEQKVFFHEAVSPEVLVNYTASANLGMCLINNYCLSYYYCLPNKMFEYIQAEIPIICSDFPDMRKVIDEYQIGEVANPEDADSVSMAIIKILKDDKIYNFYKKNCENAKIELNWQVEEKKLVNLYKNLL